MICLSFTKSFFLFLCSFCLSHSHVCLVTDGANGLSVVEGVQCRPAGGQTMAMQEALKWSMWATRSPYSDREPCHTQILFALDFKHFKQQTLFYSLYSEKDLHFMFYYIYYTVQLKYLFPFFASIWETAWTRCALSLSPEV